MVGEEVGRGEVRGSEDEWLSEAEEGEWVVEGAMEGGAVLGSDDWRSGEGAVSAAAVVVRLGVIWFAAGAASSCAVPAPCEGVTFGWLDSVLATAVGVVVVVEGVVLIGLSGFSLSSPTRRASVPTLGDAGRTT